MDEEKLLKQQLAWCLHELYTMQYIRLINSGMKLEAAKMKAGTDIDGFRVHRQITVQPAEFDHEYFSKLTEGRA